MNSARILEVIVGRQLSPEEPKLISPRSPARNSNRIPVPAEAANKASLPSAIGVMHRRLSPYRSQPPCFLRDREAERGRVAVNFDTRPLRHISIASSPVSTVAPNAVPVTDPHHPS